MADGIQLYTVWIILYDYKWSYKDNLKANINCYLSVPEVFPAGFWCVSVYLVRIPLVPLKVYILKAYILSILRKQFYGICREHIRTVLNKLEIYQLG